MIFFRINTNECSGRLPPYGRMDGFELSQAIPLIYVCLILHSTIFFLCDLADRNLKAKRHVHDTPNFRILLDTTRSLVICLEEKRSCII